LETHHNKKNTKSVPGRLYQTMVARDNIVRWTPEFAEWYAKQPTGEEARKSNPFWMPLQAITLGMSDSPAPDDFRVTLESNRVIAPESLQDAAGIFVNKAIVNGEPVTDQKLPLPTEVP